MKVKILTGLALVLAMNVTPAQEETLQDISDKIPLTQQTTTNSEDIIYISRKNSAFNTLKSILHNVHSQERKFKQRTPYERCYDSPFYVELSTDSFPNQKVTSISVCDSKPYSENPESGDVLTFNLPGNNENYFYSITVLGKRIRIFKGDKEFLINKGFSTKYFKRRELSEILSVLATAFEK